VEDDEDGAETEAVSSGSTNMGIESTALAGGACMDEMMEEK